MGEVIAAGGRAALAVSLAALLAAGAGPAWAQLGAGELPPRERAGRAPRPAGQRPEMERLARAIQKNLALDDAQAARLRDASARYAQRRNALLGEERTARRTLRDQLQLGDAADQGQVGGALNTLFDVQRRRVDLASEEQRELSGFLTPVQRARFLGLQERAQRAAERARLAREAADADARAAGVAPGP